MLLAREKVLDTRGERGEQQADLDALLTLADALNDDARPAKIYLRRTGFAGAIGDYKTTLTLAESAAAFARQAGSLEMELNALTFKAQTLLLMGGSAEAGANVDAVLARVPDVTDESVCAQALSRGAHYCCDAGDLVRAIELQRQSVDAARASGSQSQQLSNRANLALLYAVLGLYSEARSLLEETLADAEL